MYFSHMNKMTAPSRTSSPTRYLVLESWRCHAAKQAPHAGYLYLTVYTLQSTRPVHCKTGHRPAERMDTVT